MCFTVIVTATILQYTTCLSLEIAFYGFSTHIFGVSTHPFLLY